MNSGSILTRICLLGALALPAGVLDATQVSSGQQLTGVPAAAVSVSSVSAAKVAPVRRYGLILGANNGGQERTPLRYADSDARAVAAVLEELGGMLADDRVLLLEPTRSSLETAVAQLGKRIASQRQTGQRVEVVLYYSGHSDEEGLMLGSERLTYPELRRTLERLSADVQIAILDSCSSGALIRTKGGKRRSPFLTDDASSVRGHAYLTSSAEDEAAQESDRIKGSYFTQSLVTGLRGAADVTRDGRVTLNEAYQFAFHETLARTERTVGGPQHPTYDIRLAGTGDLVLTDLRGTSAGMLIEDELSGTLYIRDTSGRLIASLQKRAGQPIELGFEPGTYKVMLVQGNKRLETTLTLPPGKQVELTRAQLKPVAVEATARRGDDAASEKSLEPAEGGQEKTGEAGASGDSGASADAGAAPERPSAGEDPEGGEGKTPATSLKLDRSFLPAVIGVLPRLSTDPGLSSGHVVGLSLGVIATRDPALDGVALAGVAGWVDGDVKGAQLSGAASIAGGALEGVQASGALSVVGETVRGAQLSGAASFASGLSGALQASGAFNLATGPARGCQASGGLNVASSGLQGCQASGGLNLSIGATQGIQVTGGVNVASGGMKGFQGAGGVNVALGGFKGVQAAGGVNVAGGSSGGIQAAGGANVSNGDFAGVQAGTLNVAHGKVGNQVGVVNVAAGPVMGVQVGVINIAEDVVAPIGLLSFSRTGYHGLELAYDEQQVMSAALKTGGRLIFNRVGAGIKQEGDELWLISTLGIGAHMGGARLFTDVELVASSALKLGEFQGDHLLSELRTTVGYRFFPHFSVVAGPSLSVMTTFDDRGSPFAPAYVLYAYQGESVRVDVWPGVHVGLQF